MEVLHSIVYTLSYRQELDERVIGMHCTLDNKNFCTYSEHVLHLWTVDDLHRVHTIVGYVKCGPLLFYTGIYFSIIS